MVHFLCCILENFHVYNYLSLMQLCLGQVNTGQNRLQLQKDKKKARGENNPVYSNSLSNAQHLKNAFGVKIYVLYFQ